MCPFFRQNGGDGVYQEKENLIPQAFNSFCGLSYNNLLKRNSELHLVKFKAYFLPIGQFTLVASMISIERTRIFNLLSEIGVLMVIGYRMYVEESATY